MRIQGGGGQENGRSGRGAAHAQCAGHPEDGEAVEREHEERGGEQPRFGVEGFGSDVGLDGGSQCGCVERREGRVGFEEVERGEGVAGAVEAGRMGGIDGTGGQRFDAGGGRRKAALRV